MSKVNIQELLARVEQDRELLNELLSIFVDEFPDKLQEVRDAVLGGNLAEVAVVSHGLKGMLANLSIAQAAWCAAQIEQLARGGQAAPLKQALNALENEVQGLLSEIQAHLSEVQQ